MKKSLIIVFLASFSVVFGQANKCDKEFDKANKLVEKGKHQDAVNLLTELIKEFPDSAKLYDARGSIFLQARLYKESLDDFNKAVSKVKSNKLKLAYLVNRGSLKFQVRDFEGSYTDMMKAYDIDSLDIRVLNNLALSCDEIGKPNETLKYLEKIIQIDSNFAYAYINIGYKYRLMEQYEKAITYLDKAVKLDPKESLAYSNRSYCRMKINDLDGAMKDIDLSILYNSNNSYACKVKGMIYLEKKDKEKACENFNIAIDKGYRTNYGDDVSEMINENCK
jgi:tetratricopeptide (TPR) repeat protein